jgi:hypothetical protein
MAAMMSERGNVFAVELLRELIPEGARARTIQRILAVDGDPRVAVARKIASDQARESDR